MERPSRAVPLPCKIHGTKPQYNNLASPEFWCRECIEDGSTDYYNLLVNLWNETQTPRTR